MVYIPLWNHCQFNKQVGILILCPTLCLLRPVKSSVTDFAMAHLEILTTYLGIYFLRSQQKFSLCCGNTYVRTCRFFLEINCSSFAVDTALNLFSEQPGCISKEVCLSWHKLQPSHSHLVELKWSTKACLSVVIKQYQAVFMRSVIMNHYRRKSEPQDWN